MFLKVPITLRRMEARGLIEVGALIRERRVALNLTPGQLIDRAGIDAKTLQKLEAGERWPQEKTRRKIEPVLRWKPGGIDVLKDGGTPEELTSATLGRGLVGIVPDVPRTPNDAHFERAERLLHRSRESARQRDYLGAITGLEGVQSTVELLIGRLEIATTEEETNALEIETQSPASSEGDEGEEVVRKRSSAESPPAADEPSAARTSRILRRKVGKKVGDDPGMS